MVAHCWCACCSLDIGCLNNSSCFRIVVLESWGSLRNRYYGNVFRSLWKEIMGITFWSIVFMTWNQRTWSLSTYLSLSLSLSDILSLSVSVSGSHTTSKMNWNKQFCIVTSRIVFDKNFSYLVSILNQAFNYRSAKLTHTMYLDVT